MGNGAGRDPAGKKNKLVPRISISFSEDESLPLQGRKWPSVINLPLSRHLVTLRNAAICPGSAWAPIAGLSKVVQEQELVSTGEWEPSSGIRAQPPSLLLGIYWSVLIAPDLSWPVPEAGCRQFLGSFCPLRCLLALQWWLLTGGR